MKQGAWVAQHTIYGDSAVAGTFTNMPAADTFLFSSTRHIILVDVSGMTYVRFKVNRQSGNATNGSKLILRYCYNFSSTVSAYTDIGTTEVSVPIDTANVYVTTDWVELDPTAISYGDIYLAVVGSGGNGTLDPTFGNISVSFC